MRDTGIKVMGAMLVPCAALALAMAPARGAAPVARFVVQPGEQPLIAMQAAGSPARAAQLRAQWLASGHSLAEAAASGAPAITGGTVKDSLITVGKAGQYPRLTVSYSAGSAGYSATVFTFVSPNGKIGYEGVTAIPYFEKSGTVTFDNVVPLGVWSQPGRWTLASATVYDNAGNMTAYDATQLAGLFANTGFRVANPGLVDGIPPKIKSGKLINDTVSLSGKYPQLKALIKASDEGSGLYLGYVFIQPPGASYYFAAIAPNPLPAAHAWVKANNAFGAGDPTGTWNIKGYALCDFANNCVFSDNDADVVKLFGTDTFTVTP